MTADPRSLTKDGARVVLAGAARYENLSSLPSVSRTATDLAAIFTSKCGLDPANLTLLQDPASPAELGLALAEASEAATDVLMFYFVGHGLVSEVGELFLGTAGVDERPTRLPITGLSFDTVRRTILHSSASTVVVVLDCCFSGRAIDVLSGTDEASEAADLAQINGSYVLTASARDELALAPQGEPHTAFSGELLRLIHAGDRTAGEYLTLKDIFRHMQHSLPSRGVPAPNQRATANASNMTLATNPQFAPFPTLDPEAHVPSRLFDAIRDESPLRRAGAVAALEDLLSSTQAAVREGARDSLLRLVRDPNRLVSSQATKMWHHRGLGEIPLPEAVRSNQPAEVSFNSPREAFPAGIDFGTTNSAVAVYQDGQCRVVPNRLGERSTPSVATRLPNGEWLFGTAAKRRATSSGAVSIFSCKTKLGTDWTCTVGADTLNAEAVATMILSDLRMSAEEYLNGKLDQVVLTVPAYFDLGQRHALMQAAANAGLNVVRLVNEPTAASLAYGVDETRSQLVLVFDLGGGTLDVSLLRIEDGVVEVLATAGDNNLGGDDWDSSLADHLVDKLGLTERLRLSPDPVMLERIREAAESAKIDLSSVSEVSVSLPYLLVSTDGQHESFECVVSRDEFEFATEALRRSCAAPVNRVMKDASIAFDALDIVLLVGGATRMPAVGRLLRDLTGQVPKRDLIPDGVAIGAAIQAATLGGRIRQQLLLDVVAISLGLETRGGVMTRMIDRNSTLPTKRSEIFTTAHDRQSSVKIDLFQGEAPAASDNKLVGTFELTGIPPQKAGQPQIEVTFDLDSNGLVRVSARDLTHPNSAEIMLTSGIPKTVYRPRAQLARPAETCTPQTEPDS